MRPVERGDKPTDKNGISIDFKNYSEARSFLIERMGQYCCYCNQKLPASLAVEHVQPKSSNPNLELEWDNFLLSCTNCNSIKGKKEIELNDFIWPDIHNTHKAIEYKEDGTIEINSSIEDLDLRKKIQNLFDLVGLQRYTDTIEASDRRWKNRKDAFQKAKDALRLYELSLEKGTGAEAAKFVAGWAPDSGFFSIWFIIFDQHLEVKRELLKSFPGTALAAFDAECNPINRGTDL